MQDLLELYGHSTHTLMDMLTEYVLAENDHTFLVEGKDIGTFKGKNLDRQTAAAMAALVEPKSSAAKRQRRATENRRVLANLIERLEVTLIKTWLKFIHKEISHSKMSSGIRDELDRIYKQAMILGIDSGESGTPANLSRGLTRQESAWLESFKKAEDKNLRRLLDDIRKYSSTVRPDYRLAQYAKAVNAVFEAARMLASPPTSIITWKTHSSAPCASCTTLARYSPYTPSTLVTTPKAGSTLCLSNCKCTLIYRIGSPEEVNRIIKRNKDTKAMLQILARVKETRKPG